MKKKSESLRIFRDKNEKNKIKGKKKKKGCSYKDILLVFHFIMSYPSVHTPYRDPF